jgi:hypothetical protein
MNRHKFSKAVFSFNAAALALGLLWAEPGAAWGNLGHEIIAENGSRLAVEGSEFWVANQENLKRLATVPDVIWKRGSSKQQERSQHWFQPDGYFDSADQFAEIPSLYSAAIDKFTEVQVSKNGTAPWRVKQLFELSVKALKRKDFKTAVEMAGTMLHYVGDLSQPMQVTKNYDGADTGNKGIHSFSETKTLASADPIALAAEALAQGKKLSQDSSFTRLFDGDLVKFAFTEALRAYAKRDSVLEIDNRLGRGAQGLAAMLEIEKTCLADASATAGILLSQIWTAAGAPMVGASVISVDDPAWVAPTFTDAN